MNHHAMQQLLASIRNGSMTREQVRRVLEESITRACKIDEPETAKARTALSDAFEDFADALQRLDERLGREDGELDEMDLARIARACGAL